MFDTAVESIQNYDCEIWTVDYRLKENRLSAEMGFRRCTRTFKILRVRRGIITKKWEEHKQLWKEWKLTC